MTNYSEEILKYAIGQQVILISKDNDVCVGFLVKDTLGLWRVLSFNQEYSLGFKRSHIKQLIYLGTGYVLPKEDIRTKLSNANMKASKIRFKYLDIFKLNELVNKAGCQFI